ncbi:peroxiredoxin, Ohr subfamily [Gordonia bronchialis DSM 43247]|jgi:Ohr subfamily peroxiredoxin|uniref:Peroxiredoxin, Ohr subfamily n=1 Tax=Gordonia bronchialis (strain ATCC 25592 / DSM 43247 / BCRC 13721 / JCM 3198 / KCTC 3076 / NBRC 16047 / NCTC 10667) TaxID=526226 RepID=D0LDI2_GORB4|nr:organic hydroperoxide resistance protein [Gordonia bronchialis]ACY19802.1 peroxiredoxin, Ohr subfamily [Gordonia bronchialis DSM 43247]MCC3322575.1 organic hydroperoxide resistance protein [Gordonia bronchialis]QGS26317.1 Ohr family peroxiredoxin [Gordonia bronchialis]UAK37334.1 organic hydroperoxide resistance protein [Gordonia bronchialis]STQ62574.1 General stress protein 17o [Gordonia bronchialis]
MAIEPAYRISSKASGGGRDGEVVSETGQIDLDLQPPKELGGSGEGSNPEELFSAGYAACFLGALRATSKQAGSPVPDESTVKVTIGIGKDPADGGFGLTADIEVYIPGVDEAKAQELADGAHAFCPYSKATRGNIAQTVSVSV